MTLRRLGLRARLGLALGGVAVLAVVLTTLLADAGLDRRLREAADARLGASALHSAELAAELYGRDGRWTPANLAELQHLAQMNGYRLVVRDRAGRALTPASTADGDHSAATVTVRGEHVGAVDVRPFGGSALTPQDEQLRRRLNDLHVVAGVLALALGAAAAVALAPGLARPLRRLTEVAGRMERGELDARTPRGGGPEVEQVGHALNRLASTLRLQEERRREAAADVAHELRTPLGAIVSRIEAAQDGVLEDDEANLEAMRAEAARLARLVDDLSRLADAQKPGLLLDRRDVDLARVAAVRAQAAAEQFAVKHISLETRLDHAVVQGDEGRLGQIVDNLLSNAARYTDPGGSVTLTVGTRDGEGVLEVVDTGIGIQGEDLPHVFERFWRGEKSRSRATGGAGIGLAIVQELVRAHDGRVDLDSAPGVGTTVRVSLPAHCSRMRHLHDGSM